MREYLDKIISLEQEQPVEEDTLEEGAFKDMMIDIEDGMSKEEFEKTYPGMGDKYDEIKKEIMDRQDETVEENDIEMEEDCGCEDDAMVSVPVQELADILQLAGYENYADKIEEYANEPEEEYSDTEDQLIGLSGGLNRPKKQYPASAPGDNPMDQEPREIEESVEDKLYKSYKDFLEAEEIKSND
jgi:glutathionylspermidine synthase